MRSFLAAAAATVVLPACTTGLELRPKEPSAVSSTVAVPPGRWVMSPDSFGPITVETTRSQALATGAYAEAPSPCSRERLDWRGQSYEAHTANADVDGDGTPDKERTKPFLGAVTFDEGTAAFIDPGKDTVTDQGIRKSDSLSRLQLTYGDDLILGRDQSPGTGSFAVNGMRSHLVFEV